MTLPAPLGHPPLLVRDGAAIPMNIAAQSFATRADARAFAVFAPVSGSFEAACYEDDGETEAWRTGGFGHWVLSVAASAAALTVALKATGDLAPQGPVSLLFRPNEQRPIAAALGRIVSDGRSTAGRQIVVEV